MVVIRLQRVGKHNRPSYRIVAADSKASVKGKFIEIIGFYDPIKKLCEFKNDRIDYWKKLGAQLSDTVSFLVEKGGKIEQKKKNKPNRKSVLKAEHAEKEKKAKTETAAEAAKVPAEEVTATSTAEAKIEEKTA